MVEADDAVVALAAMTCAVWAVDVAGPWRGMTWGGGGWRTAVLEVVRDVIAGDADCEGGLFSLRARFE